jgi:hypothetical protein
MNEHHFRDLTRKAMIREYICLRNHAINILEASNELYGYIERTYEPDEDLQQLLDKFDSVADHANL